jgi:hypothetical protein
MKNKLTLSLLLSLSTGIAMHASDAYKQEINALINKKLPDVKYWDFLSHTRPSLIRLAFKPVPWAFVISPHLPLCMSMPVFTHGSVDYTLTKIDRNVTVNYEGERTHGLTVVTLTPRVQQ